MEEIAMTELKGPPSHAAVRERSKRRTGNWVCEECGGHNTGVVDTRPVRYPVYAVRRRRCCFDCNKRWTTYEVAEAMVQIDVRHALVKAQDSLNEAMLLVSEALDQARAQMEDLKR